MAKEEKYLLVDERVVPDIFKKVLEAKKYLATGKAKNSSEAVRLANISRSAFYKYKDRVMEYNSSSSNSIVTFYLTMEDIPGVCHRSSITLPNTEQTSSPSTRTSLLTGSLRSPYPFV